LKSNQRFDLAFETGVQIC